VAPVAPGYAPPVPYEMPKYEQEYTSPPQRHFIHNTGRKKLQEAQNNYYAKKRGVTTPYSEKSFGAYEGTDNPRRKDRFEDFIKYTAPRLQYKAIVKIQALFRGAYARKRIFPQI
jgi:hypothetical protein